MFQHNLSLLSCARLFFIVAVVNCPAMVSAQERSSLDTYLAEEGAFLDEVENDRLLVAQVLQSTVSQELAAARREFDVAPEAAIAELKHMLQNIEAAPELTAEVRGQLRTQVITAIREGQRRLTEKQQRDQIAAARRAAGAERRRILDASLREQEKLKQINARFSSLMNEGRFREAEDAAYRAREMAPRDPFVVASVHTSRMTGYVNNQMALRETRHKGVADALFATERAHVPVSDEPPIVYPNAQVWEELTRRREKYSAMSLEKTGSAEEQIFDALRQPTTMEFIEMPLQDVVDYVEDLHDIEVEIDFRAIEEVGLSSDTPITRNLKGISLRSALRLVLGELDLTYTVRDEVLLITTREEVEADLTTKVYPVADLVLPIRTGAGANPFQLGAGLGGQGGFGGGLQQGGGNQMQGGNNLLGGNFGNDLFGRMGPGF